MARRVEEIASVRRVDVKENAGNDNRLFLEQLLEECLDVDQYQAVKQHQSCTYQTVVQRFREFLKVKPDVEGARRGDRNI